MVEKFDNIFRLYIDTIPKCDRQADRQTDERTAIVHHYGDAQWRRNDFLTVLPFFLRVSSDEIVDIVFTSDKNVRVDNSICHSANFVLRRNYCFVCSLSASSSLLVWIRTYAKATRLWLKSTRRWSNCSAIVKVNSDWLAGAVSGTVVELCYACHVAGIERLSK